MRRYRFAFSLAALPLLALSMTACGSGDEGGESPSAPVTTEAAPDLTGTWKQIEADTDYQEATIDDETITINWVSDEDKSKSLYWTGSFEAPDSPGAFTWESKGDMEAMESAWLASTSESKTFSYENDLITYEVSAMGTTATMQLEKQD